MSKKRLMALSSGALVALLLLGLIGGTLVYADETDPTTGEPVACGHWGLFGLGGRSWAVFDAAAEALGLTPDGLFAELHDAGKTLTEVAQEQGVDTDALEEAMNASRIESMRERIQQAVEDGTLSQDQADWMLEGLDKGLMGGRHGMGHGGFGHPEGPFGEGA